MYYIRGHVCLLSVINLDGVKIVFICKISSLQVITGNEKVLLFALR